MQLIRVRRQSRLWISELLFAIQLPLFIFAISFSVGEFEVLGQSVGSYLSGQVIMIFKVLGLLIPLSLFALLLIRRQFHPEDTLQVLRNHCYIIAFIIISGALLLTAVKPAFSLFKWIILAASYSALFCLLYQYIERYHDDARHYIFKHLLYSFALLFLFPYFAIMNFGPALFFPNARALIGCGIAHPNLYSSFLCYGFIFALFYNALQGYSFGHGRPQITEWLMRLSIILVFPVLIIMTNSRGVILSMLIGFCVTYVFWFFTRQSVQMHIVSLITLNVILGLTIAIVAGWIPTDVFLSKVSRYEDGSDLTTLTGRTDIWNAAFSTNTWKSYLLGNGYAVMMPELAFKLETGTLYGTHNTPMMVLFATGVFGIFVYFMFYLQNLMRVPIIQHYDGFRHAGFFVCALATFGVHQNVETFFGLNLDGIFTLFLIFFAFDSEIYNDASFE